MDQLIGSFYYETPKEVSIWISECVRVYVHCDGLSGVVRVQND